MNDTVPMEFRSMARLDSVRVRTAWQRASPTLPTHGKLLWQVGKLLLERLEDIRLTPECILDLGDRTGLLARQLQERWPKARIVALTLAESLARQGRYRSLPWQRRPWNIAGEGTRLPFARGQFDLVISNMALHWSSDVGSVLREIRRVLVPDRLLLFTVAGSETLAELQSCLAQLDQERYGRVWVRGPELPDLQIMGDWLQSSGFVLPVVDRERLELPFSDVPWLARQLRAMGAGNHQRLRPAGLMGKGYLAALEQYYIARLRPGQPLTANLEILFGHAWKAIKE